MARVARRIVSYTGGVIGIDALLALIYFQFFRTPAAPCGQGQWLIEGLCYRAWPYFLVAMGVGALLYGISFLIAAKRKRPYASWEWLNFSWVFLVANGGVMLGAFLYAVIYEAVHDLSVVLPVGGVAYRMWILALAATLILALMSTLMGLCLLGWRRASKQIPQEEYIAREEARLARKAAEKQAARENREARRAERHQASLEKKRKALAERKGEKAAAPVAEDQGLEVEEAPDPAPASDSPYSMKGAGWSDWESEGKESRGDAVATKDELRND